MESLRSKRRQGWVQHPSAQINRTIRKQAQKTFRNFHQYECKGTKPKRIKISYLWRHFEINGIRARRGIPLPKLYDTKTNAEYRFQKCHQYECKVTTTMQISKSYLRRLVNGVDVNCVGGRYIALLGLMVRCDRRRIPKWASGLGEY